MAKSIIKSPRQPVSETLQIKLVSSDHGCYRIVPNGGFADDLAGAYKTARFAFWQILHAYNDCDIAVTGTDRHIADLHELLNLAPNDAGEYV
jgi:hypothetical protein